MFYKNNIKLRHDFVCNIIITIWVAFFEAVPNYRKREHSSGSWHGRSPSGTCKKCTRKVHWLVLHQTLAFMTVITTAPLEVEAFTTSQSWGKSWVEKFLSLWGGRLFCHPFIRDETTHFLSECVDFSWLRIRLIFWIRLIWISKVRKRTFTVFRDYFISRWNLNKISNESKVKN